MPFLNLRECSTFAAKNKVVVDHACQIHSFDHFATAHAVDDEIGYFLVLVFKAEETAFSPIEELVI